MDAIEARQLTKHAFNPDIDPLIAAIDERIAAAAQKGQSQISSPDTGHLRDGNIIQLSGSERRALRRHYEARGFKWRDHPKVGHPCCRDFTTLSW